MLKIKIPSIEQWDNEREEFISSKGQSLQLEHSLVSISKWESVWRKPFLSKDKKTYDETIDYIKCMTITQNVDDDVYTHVTQNIVNEVNDYIGKNMTATVFMDNNKKSNKEIITSEIIYYWMIAMNIPFECQKWHLDRLLTLINVCNIKNNPPKKMSRRERVDKNRALNEERKNKLNTKG